MKYSEQLIKKLFGIDSDDFLCSSLGDLSHKDDFGVLSYISSDKYLLDLHSNSSIKAVFVSKGVSDQVDEKIIKIIVDDPLWYYVSTRNYVASQIEYLPTVFGRNCNIHPSAVIANTGVNIGNNVTIGANVTIKEGVTLRDMCVIFPGVVLGTDGFEYKKTSRGTLAVKHDGEVLIGEQVEIGANSTIAKGFSYRNTVIGDSTKTDSLVYVAHGVQCGKDCLIASKVSINGHVTIGDDVWIGPSSTISNRLHIGSRVFIALGSVVVRNVNEGTRVAGNFALPYALFKNDWVAKGGE